MTAGASEVRFERLTSRSGLAWFGGTLLVVLAMSAYYFVTDPPNRPYTALGPLMVLGGLVVIARHRQSVEAGDRGPVLAQRRTFGTRRVPLRTARRVMLRPAGGSVQVLAEDDRTSAFAPVLIVGLYVERSQPAGVLRALVEALSGSRAAGAAEVVEQLRAQLAHVERGGSAATSPLATMAKDRSGVIGALGGLGAGGGVADQL